MPFELIDTPPRLSVGFRIGLAFSLDEYDALAAQHEDRLRAQWPLVNAAGDRLRRHLESLAAASAMYDWAQRKGVFVADDLHTLRCRRAQSRRRFLKAVKRMSRTPVASASIATPAPTPVPASSLPHASADPAHVLHLPGYVDRPADRWLELYELLHRLPPQERPSRGLFAKNRGQTLWDWACGRRGLFLPPGRQPWATFIGGLPVAIVARLLPTWAGMVGCAPVDARTLEGALGRIGMAAAIEELDAAWLDALSSGTKTVPFTPFSWVPAQGTWYALMDDLDRLQP
jgi:hypothetical protein